MWMWAWERRTKELAHCSFCAFARSSLSLTLSGSFYTTATYRFLSQKIVGDVKTKLFAFCIRANTFCGCHALVRFIIHFKYVRDTLSLNLRDGGGEMQREVVCLSLCYAKAFCLLVSLTFRCTISLSFFPSLSLHSLVHRWMISKPRQSRQWCDKLAGCSGVACEKCAVYDFTENNKQKFFGLICCRMQCGSSIHVQHAPQM